MSQLVVCTHATIIHRSQQLSHYLYPSSRRPENRNTFIWPSNHTTAMKVGPGPLAVPCLTMTDVNTEISYVDNVSAYSPLADMIFRDPGIRTATFPLIQSMSQCPACAGADK